MDSLDVETSASGTVASAPVKWDSYISLSARYKGLSLADTGVDIPPVIRSDTQKRGSSENDTTRPSEKRREILSDKASTHANVGSPATVNHSLKPTTKTASLPRDVTCVQSPEEACIAPESTELKEFLLELSWENMKIET
ncbi:hypothetical protein GQ44DRAFT_779729 [Phaeosphaeriaceae sp. PMI808]|nr:hypothetical protein GQ44DRAFT_779729 [Phaeosphaeriaceae sp. PMI808]